MNETEPKVKDKPEHLSPELKLAFFESIVTSFNAKFHKLEDDLKVGANFVFRYRATDGRKELYVMDVSEHRKDKPTEDAVARAASIMAAAVAAAEQNHAKVNILPSGDLLMNLPANVFADDEPTASDMEQATEAQVTGQGCGEDLHTFAMGEDNAVREVFDRVKDKKVDRPGLVDHRGQPL